MLERIVLAGPIVADRYRIEQRSRSAANGDVYSATDLRTGIVVEVKTIDGDSRAARLRCEARALGSIRSDHVQRLLDVTTDTKVGPLLVTERIEGESLLDRLKRAGPMPPAELHPLIAQTWLGLVAVHAAGVVHRDIKPSNLLIAQRDDGSPLVKIVGFDVCATGAADDPTEMGQSLGTFSFMAPEQIGRAKIADPRADVYACSTVIFQALSGALPYTARNILVMVEMKCKTDARRLSEAVNGPVDPRLDAFLARGLARAPGDRFSSAAEALSAWQALRPCAPGG